MLNLQGAVTAWPVRVLANMGTAMPNNNGPNNKSTGNVDPELTGVHLLFNLGAYTLVI